jgi:predicted branched-subunit amino acid permease
MKVFCNFIIPVLDFAAYVSFMGIAIFMMIPIEPFDKSHKHLGVLLIVFTSILPVIPILVAITTRTIALTLMAIFFDDDPKPKQPKPPEGVIDDRPFEMKLMT